MNSIDIHSHLQFSQFDNDREEILGVMKKQQLGTITVGTDYDSSLQAVELAVKNKNIWATVGHHPTDHESYEGIDEYEKMIDSDRVVAVGECGLDYYHEPRSQVRNHQLPLLTDHIELALESNLPLMIHARPSTKTMNAYEDIIDVFKQFDFKLENPGTIHFFVGDIAIARQFLELGFTLSFDGPITFTDEYNEVIKYAPIDMIHAETDAPFASPVPYRGQRNSPLYVKHVIKALADIRGEIDVDNFNRQLVDNARRVFNLV